MERWPGQLNLGGGRGNRPTRIGVGWIHTFDERLFKADGGGEDVPTPPWGTGTFRVIHRTPDGRGRSFSCTVPGSAGSFTCTSSDGTQDVLDYATSAPNWTLRTPDGIHTRFDSGGALVDKFDRAGEGWTVHYHTSGTFDDYIDYVEDHFGRRLEFVWSAPPLSSEQITLDRLEDGSSVVLAEYYYTRRGLYLEEVATASVNEKYTYASMLADGHPIELRYLTSIQRNAQTVVSITYDQDESARSVGRGRVTAITAPDGSYAFRAPGAANNLCDTIGSFDESRTAMIIDRSTPAAPVSCASDSACGTGLACAGGVCRPFTCQQYASFASGTVNYNAVTNIGGNCPCGGADSYEWSTPTSTIPARPRRRIGRDGLVTTMNYDSYGRMVARCAGDLPPASEPTPDASTCPTTGELTTWEYETGSSNPQVRFERRRSRLSSSNLAETEYVYDSTTRRLRYVHRRGYTRDAGDTLIGPVTQTTEYVYGVVGGVTRLTEVLGPAGERTTYEYWPSGSGYSTGMLRYRRVYHNTTGALVTTYSSYTSTGRPQLVVDPSGTNSTYTYDHAGLRLTSMSVAGRTTSFAYDAAGRLQTVTEPSGRRLVYTYDALSRVQRVDTFDSAGAGAAERLTHVYDAAGRRTQTSFQRVNSGGGVVATAYQVDATYDTHGFTETTDIGPQSPVTYTYDTAAMGYLESLTRGDGNLEEYDHDAFGRESAWRRFFSTGVSGQHAFEYRNELGSNLETGSTLPTRVTEPNGQVRTYVYDDFGHLVRSSSSEWGTERWIWTNGRLTSIRHADDRWTAYTYDRAGRITVIDQDSTNPSLLGQDFRFEYDLGDAAIPCPTYWGCVFRTGRLARVQIEYAPGLFWYMYYDYAADGQVASERYPDGREVRYQYDSQGRMTRMYYPTPTTDSVRFEYDAVTGDGHDPTEVSKIVGERSGSDYITWGRSFQRDAFGAVTSVLTHDASTVAQTISYRADGRLNCWFARRRNGGSFVSVLDRCYQYSADGSAAGHDSIVGADAPRTWFYDGANRLTCATSAFGSSSCPTGSPLIESYVYDAGDNRTSMGSIAGTTGYLLSGNSLYDEYPPGSRTIWYAYSQFTGGVRTYDEEVTSGSPTNARFYTYDTGGRLRVLSLPRPTPTPSTTRQQHTITVLYDHLSRPLSVFDLNQATSKEARQFFYYDLENRLIARDDVPDASAPTNHTVDRYAYVDPMLVGDIRTVYPAATETYLYHVLQPEGLPAVSYSFNRTTFATSEVWRAQWGPFGTRLTTTGTASYAPPFVFAWQLLLPSSDASWWNGTTLYTSRGALALNRWRIFDPRAGQYMQPEPLLGVGFAVDAHPYGYVRLAPGDLVDPDGRQEVDSVTAACRRNPQLCREALRPPPSPPPSICQYAPWLCLALGYGAANTHPDVRPEPSPQAAECEDDDDDDDDWCLSEWRRCQGSHLGGAGRPAGRQRGRRSARTRGAGDRCYICYQQCQANGGIWGATMGGYDCAWWGTPPSPP